MRGDGWTRAGLSCAARLLPRPSLIPDGRSTRARDVVGRVRAAATEPVPALPVDVFRVLAGVLAAVWFAQAFAEAPEFSGPGGLIDHRLSQQLFPYTRISLFQPGMPLVAFQAAYATGVVACVLVAAGVRARLMAFVAYVLAVSTYRWNFLVMYVDDEIIHLVLFWLVLLPTGRTLALGRRRRGDRNTLDTWRREWVPGLVVRCMLANVALIYVTAGIWKWTSPMWRHGTALAAVLQMPIARAPSLPRPALQPVLAVATWSVLIVEPMLALLVILPTGHRLKWMLLVAAVGFHAGIVASLKIPYANVALLAAMVLVFREELMSAIGGAGRAPPDRSLRHAGPAGVLGMLTLLLLVAAMAGEATVPSWRGAQRLEPTTARDGRAGFAHSGHNLFYAPLWVIGLAQSYRLFDWIDDRNWDVRYEVTVADAKGAAQVDPGDVFPSSSTHGILLQSYLHGLTWGRVAPDRVGELRTTIAERIASRYCARFPQLRRVVVHTAVRRIRDTTPTTAPWHVLMRFGCAAAGGRGVSALRLAGSVGR